MNASTIGNFVCHHLNTFGAPGELKASRWDYLTFFDQPEFSIACQAGKYARIASEVEWGSKGTIFGAETQGYFTTLSKMCLAPGQCVPDRAVEDIN